MAKKRLTSPTFDASLKTVTHASFSDVTLAGIQLIVNVTDNIVIYNFADATKGGTLSTDTLTLTYDTTSMDDTDELMVLVEDGVAATSVSGTVTAELSATDNAVLDNIDADLTTIIGHVDGIEGLLTTIDGDTGTISTNSTTLAGAVSGTEMQVDVVAALPAGTNNIGDVDVLSIAAGDNNIGNVDVVTLPGVAGDVASGSADSGNPVKVGAKYNATAPGPLTDGHRVDLQAGSRGSLRTELFIPSSSASNTASTSALADGATNTIARYIFENYARVYNGTTWDRQRGDTNGTYTVGNVAHDAADASNPVKIGGYAKATAPTDVSADGDRVNAWFDLAGRLQIGDGAGSLTVDATNLDIRDIDKANDDILVYANTAKDGSGTSYVPLVDADGHLQIDVLSGGLAGTEYTEGATDASITGGVMLMEAAADTIVPVQGTVADGVLVNLGSNNDVTVAGVSTAANQTTMIGHLDGVEGLLTTIDGDTGTLAGAVSGTEMQVDVVAALPAGTNTIGSVKLTDGTDTADILDLANSNPLTVAIVDGSGDQLTSFGGGTQYTEDAAAAADPVGTMNMAVRADALAAVTSTDGDNIALRSTNKGELYVKQTDAIPVTDNAGSLTVDNGGTFAVQVDGSALTALQLIDDPVVTLGSGTYSEATTKATVMSAVRRDADTTLVDTTNEFAPLQVDANGRLKVEVFSGETLPVSLTSTTVTGTVAVTQSGTWDEVGINDSGNSITVDDGGSSLTVDGTVGVSGTVTVDSELPAAAALADNTANPTTTSVGVFPHWYDGATWDRAAGTAADGLLVNLGANNDVTITGVSTAANQTTIIGHLDGVEGLLTTIDSDTGGILTAVQTLDNAISGTEMQVDVVAALPAGTNNIGDVDIASIAAGDNNIGNVDIASIAAGDNNIGNVDVVTLPALAAGTNAIGRVGHDITGIGHGVTTVTTAGTDVALAASTSCKRVVIQSQTDNTGLIAVGATGVDATVATGTGIILYPGDTFELEIDNLADVFIDSTVNGEGVRYTYFT